MSLPAPAPVDLWVARARVGLARGLALAEAARRRAGQGAPGEYRSPFPARLRIGRAVIVGLSLLWLAAGFSGLDATRAIVRTVGHDTAPSVAAAEAIRTGLAAANADYALAMLSSEGTDGSFLSAMRARLEAVRTAIVAAAENITYGEEERGHILTVLDGLGNYEEIVGRSFASAGDTRRDLAFEADDLLHRTALPAAFALEGANAGHLTEGYGDYLGRWPVWWLAAASVLLTVSLVAVQVDVIRTARRILNPGLAVATLTVVAVSALVILRLHAAQADLSVAKVNAFDSIRALSDARAVAANADAAQTFGILALGDAARVKRQQDTFDDLTSRLLPLSATETVRFLNAGRKVRGYLGDELANVTFDGEQDAALAAVWAFDDVRSRDRQIRNAEVLGERSGALASKASDVPWSARTAFTRFDEALVKILAINQSAFVSSIASAESDDAPLGAALVAGFVVAVAAAWFGIRQRLDEYRF